MSIDNLITGHIETWTTAQVPRKSGGRGRSKKSNGQYGIKKLRELILDLAVRGKLVPQDPNDEPARVLLEKIAEEKARLIEEGKSKKQKPLPEIIEDEKPFELPPGWVWSKLGNLGETNIGLTYSPKDISDTGTPVLRSNNIQAGKLDFSNLVKVEKTIREKALVNEGDLLICARNGSKALVGKTARITGLSEVMAFGAFMAILRSKANQYLLYFINSPLFRKAIDEVNTTTINQITQGNLKNTVAPIPPLTEQYRIVAKVDELMALCDQLEQEQTDNTETHQLLVKTLLDTLTNATDHADFIESWQRIEANFDILFTTEASIDELKQTILQLAVMGKLIPQDPDDEPASVLLEKIANEKARLVKEGKIKKQKPLPEVSEEEQPFELPLGWQLIRLGEAIHLISGQHLKPAEYSETQDKEMIPYLTGPAEFGLENPCATRFTLQMRTTAEVGDILITCKGSGVGKLNIADTQIAISRQLMSMQPIVISSQYLFLMGDSLNKNIRSKIVGIAIPGISREDVLEAIIGMPPLAEQQRIVVKVNNLFKLCDSLSERLNDTETTQVQLADAIVGQTIA